MNKQILLLLSFLLCFYLAAAQYSTAPGEWRTHFPYLHTKQVETAGDKVYAATDYGLFYIDQRDMSRTTLSKLDGLSGNRVSLLAWDDELELLLIAYADSRIDMISKNSIFNINDLYRKQITADKSIHRARFLNGKLWLACGFGIIVINPEGMEVEDTYLIGDMGMYTSVYDVCIYQGRYYAATAEGVKWANMNTSNLADYANWQEEAQINALAMGGSQITRILAFNGQLWAQSSSISDTSTSMQEQLWVYGQATGWQEKNAMGQGKNHIILSQGKLIISSGEQMTVYTASNGTLSSQNLPHKEINDAAYDNNGKLWMASSYSGLVSPSADGASYAYYSPNGPYNEGAYKLTATENSLWVAGGGFQRNGTNNYSHNGLHFFDGQMWHSVTGWSFNGSGLFMDLMDVLPISGTSNRAWAASWSAGLFQFTVSNLDNQYNASNSILAYDDYLQGQTKISSVAYDSKGALWMLNPRTENKLKVIKPDGSWAAIKIPGDELEILMGLYINSLDQLWFISSNSIYSPGLIIYDFNGTYDNTDDDTYKKLAPITDREGSVISKDIYSITEDDDGVMWVGTATGPVLFYSAYKAFESGFYGTQVKITKEDDPDYADLLLKDETIQCICVDGANRKWLGTANSGAYLVSDDGTERILHFTEENSPLPSNNIYSIAITGESGEVFFGTDYGIVSYRGDATEGQDEFGLVYAYPNPVRPDYTGDIYIAGLIKDCNVKITDISGRLVYETTSQGGQATWDGRNLNGRRVQTGVYLVFLTNDDGSKTKVTKLLFIN